MRDPGGFWRCNSLGDGLRRPLAALARNPPAAILSVLLGFPGNAIWIAGRIKGAPQAESQPHPSAVRRYFGDEVPAYPLRAINIDSPVAAGRVRQLRVMTLPSPTSAISNLLNLSERQLTSESSGLSRPTAAHRHIEVPSRKRPVRARRS